MAHGPQECFVLQGACFRRGFRFCTHRIGGRGHDGRVAFACTRVSSQVCKTRFPPVSCGWQFFLSVAPASKTRAVHCLLTTDHIPWAFSKLSHQSSPPPPSASRPPTYAPCRLCGGWLRASCPGSLKVGHPGRGLRMWDGPSEAPPPGEGSSGSLGSPADGYFLKIPCKRWTLYSRSPRRKPAPATGRPRGGRGRLGRGGAADGRPLPRVRAVSARWQSVLFIAALF